MLIRLAAWAARVSPRRLLMASIVVALATIALKTGAWAITGSVALLSDAMESLVNLAAAMFGFAMVTVAARPADDDHPYGHHKAEYLSAVLEGVLIVVAALLIIREAIPALRAAWAKTCGICCARTATCSVCPTAWPLARPKQVKKW